MPEPFQAERLCAELLPLAASSLPPSAEQLAYQRHYGLDLGTRHPGLRSRLGCFTVDGLRIVSQLWQPAAPKATLILLHGYYDHMGLYRHVIDWALGENLAVLACDLPGHGLSEGARASIDDFAAYQRTLQGLFAEAASLDLPQPWHLCGQSTGGAILLDFLLLGQPRPEPGACILLAPLVRPRAWAMSKLSYHLLSPFKAEIPRRFSANSGDTEFLDFVQHRDPLQPRTLPTAWVGALARWIPRLEAAPRSPLQPLVVQGDADMTVDWRHNLKVLQDKFDQPQILHLPGAKHHLANESAAIRQRYFAFLSERLR
ncbi:alpha/beta hydrolase [Pseudomonas alcaligenes]|uniref:Alpha/beta hydrolase n=1 Tax=Aquipseudomonas alcaligenes TaxID=43263 RepID=A0ABR7S501_AQUAC|nr:alpha/beta hydrolase [Pseudomonas alcaligenes]MBC9252655.1 alpha/beta hydrolase [Pseudomonas alcaligenes]